MTSVRPSVGERPMVGGLLAGPPGPPGPAGPPGNPSSYELRGTGSPQGTVAAPVGSYYTDAAATNGAIRWIKEAGTGPTGWRVLWGDTGTRNLIGAALNGWAGTGIYLRRRNDLVTVSFQAVSGAGASGAGIVALPNGFELDQLYQARFPIGLGNNGLLSLVVAAQVLTLGAALPPPAELHGQLSFPTAQQWPANLPGT